MTQNAGTQAGKQVIYNFAVRIGGLSVGFLTDLIFARHLGSDHFGLFSLGISIMSIISVFAVSGFPGALVRAIAKAGTGPDSRAAGYLKLAMVSVLWVSVLAGAALVAGRTLLASSVFDEPRLNAILLPTAIQLVLFSLCSLWLGVFEGARISHLGYAIREVLVRVFKIAFFFLVAHWLGATAVSLMWGFCLGQCAALLLYFTWGRRYGGDTFGLKAILTAKLPPFVERKDFIRFNWTLLLNAVMGLLLMHASRLLLGYSGSPAQIGIFSVAINIGSLLVLGLGAVNVVVMPMVARLHQAKDQQNLRVLFKASFNAVTMFNAPLFALMFYYAGDLLFLYGPDFVEGKDIVVLIGAAFFYYTVTGSNYPFLIMSTQYRYETAVTVVGGVGNALLCYLTIPAFGISGAAVAFLVSKATMTTLRNIILYKYYHLTPISPQSLWFLILIPACLALKHLLAKTGLPVIAEMALFLGAVSALSLLIYYHFVIREKEREILKNVRTSMLGVFYGIARQTAG
ncbi:MAG: hypothetical protein VR64_11555 [Desulfatitalea sp. BRH_c12]|nr:MAG: hypothetical protein VR64_11555 [Desulfatitalea sp. BRH_c12]